MLLRSAFEIAGRLFYALAIALTTVSSASAILQATPLLVVAGAAVIFAKGWAGRAGRRWWWGSSGVLVILRPGVEGFTALSPAGRRRDDRLCRARPGHPRPRRLR